MDTYYLAHHGIMGMKWGVWNEETRRKRTGGNNRSAKSYERELNSLDKKATREKAKYMQKAMAADRQYTKAKKAKLKGKEYNKYLEKGDKQYKEANEHKQRESQIRKQSWDRLGDIKNKGMDIKVHETIRDGRSFMEKSASAAAFALPMAALTAVSIGSAGTLSPSLAAVSGLGLGLGAKGNFDLKRAKKYHQKGKQYTEHFMIGTKHANDPKHVLTNKYVVSKSSGDNGTITVSMIPKI